MRLSTRHLPALFALILLAAAALAGPGAAQDAERPQRIVSLNLCADQYLIALADREQVAALTHYSRDPALSFHAAEARDWPVVEGNAEQVLLLAPDLIIASPFRRRETRELLAPFGFPTLEIRPAQNFAQIVDQVRAIAAAIGHPERGERLIAAMAAELAEIPPPDGPPPVTVHYQRRGFVTGTETLLDEIMTRSGLANLAARLGHRAIRRVTLEEIVAEAPDLLLVSREDLDPRDLGTELLLHPVLRSRYPAERRLALPQAFTVCGGPPYPHAVALLSEQARAARSELERGQASQDGGSQNGGTLGGD